MSHDDFIVLPNGAFLQDQMWLSDSQKIFITLIMILIQKDFIWSILPSYNTIKERKIANDGFIELC